MAAIPIVDLYKLCSFNFSPTREDWTQTTTCMKEALQKIGFVYIKNHGLSQSKIFNVFEESKYFFNLDIQSKNKYQRDFQSTFHGYTKVGGERMTLDTSLEMREMFDIALADQGTFSTCPYPDEECPGFKPAMRSLIQEITGLVKVILRLLAKALNLEDEYFFINLHKNVEDSSVPNFTQLRTLFYPKIPQNKLQPGIVRCAEHTDYGTITLLLQDSMGGLQIKSVDGDWVPASPIPGCILVNVGDMLELWSGGLFPSSVHRVIVPEEEIKRSVPRQSVALFVKPDNKILVYPIIRRETNAVFKTKFSIEEDNNNNDKFNMKDSKKKFNGVYAGDHFVKRTIYHHSIAQKNND